MPTKKVKKTLSQLLESKKPSKKVTRKVSPVVPVTDKKYIDAIPSNLADHISDAELESLDGAPLQNFELAGWKPVNFSKLYPFDGYGD